MSETVFRRRQMALRRKRNEEVERRVSQYLRNQKKRPVRKRRKLSEAEMRENLENNFQKAYIEVLNQNKGKHILAAIKTWEIITTGDKNIHGAHLVRAYQELCELSVIYSPDRKAVFLVANKPIHSSVYGCINKSLHPLCHANETLFAKPDDSIIFRFLDDKQFRVVHYEGQNLVFKKN